MYLNINVHAHLLSLQPTSLNSGHAESGQFGLTSLQLAINFLLHTYFRTRKKLRYSTCSVTVSSPLDPSLPCMSIAFWTGLIWTTGWRMWSSCWGSASQPVSGSWSCWPAREELTTSSESWELVSCGMFVMTVHVSLVPRRPFLLECTSKEVRQSFCKILSQAVDGYILFKGFEVISKSLSLVTQGNWSR